MIPFIHHSKTVILANGAFPQHTLPLLFLREADRIICCDGATENLLKIGMEPDYIVGDLDSLSDELKTTYSAILHHNPDQESNDLTKAIHFCINNGWKEITVLGATGKREDHSIANTSLLADYAEFTSIQMITDYGIFTPILQSDSLESFPGQQISIFSLTPETIFTTTGLHYPLVKRTLSSWWQGTLNEASERSFEVLINSGKVLIFRAY